MDAPITREKLVEMYAAYPGALAEEVRDLFAVLYTDDDRVRHNVAADKIVRMCIPQHGLPEHRRPKKTDVQEINTEYFAAQNRLCKNVARAIIETALQEPTGGPKDG